MWVQRPRIFLIVTISALSGYLHGRGAFWISLRGDTKYPACRQTSRDRWVVGTGYLPGERTHKQKQNGLARRMQLIHQSAFLSECTPLLARRCPVVIVTRQDVPQKNRSMFHFTCIELYTARVHSFLPDLRGETSTTQSTPATRFNGQSRSPTRPNVVGSLSRQSQKP